MNPFSEIIDRDNLFNITNGRRVTEQVSQFLLNAINQGALKKK